MDDKHRRDEVWLYDDEGCAFEPRVPGSDRYLLATPAREAAPAMLEALIEARSQLEEYERAATGETYNSPQINAAIAAAIGEGNSQ